MKSRHRLLLVFLWLSVINFSIWIGGTLFHMIVVLPLWSQPLPESIYTFFGGTRAYEYLLDFYGPQWMAFRILPIIITLVLGWNNRKFRNYLSITLLTLAAGLLLSFITIFPINEAIMANGGAGHSTEEIKQMVNTWIWGDRLRFAILSLGYIFLLCAFRLPLKSMD